jgi:3'-5' exoribonuclease
MSRPKPSPVRLHEMTSGQHGDFFALLVEKNRAATREGGKPFYTCRFRDARRTATCMVWGDSPQFEECEQHWKAGEFYKVRGRFVEDRKYGPQIEVAQLRRVNDTDVSEGFDPLDFVERSRFHPDDMFADLKELVGKHIQDEPLRRLVLTILDRNETAVKNLPATTKHFYPFHGGLLEHTLSVARNCLLLAEKYVAHYPDLQPPLNVDLIVAGAVLHDIGRVREFDSSNFTPERTIPGHLLGHLFLGRDLVRDAARELADVDPELLQILEHLIVSHLNLPEWGSLRLPLVPESLILHHVDDLDAKLEMYVRCLVRDQEAGPLTARDPILGRQLLKTRAK